MKILILAVLASLTCHGKADLCQTNFTLGELPQGLLDEVVSLITQGTVVGFFGCRSTVTIDPKHVKLWLYTRNNPEEPVLPDPENPINLDTTKPIKMLLPGWLCNITNSRMPEIKNAYLSAEDYNVITVEWTVYALENYADSYCYVPEIAKLLAKFLCGINKNQNVDLSGIHVLGHSMGGQMAGIVGQEVQKQCQIKIGRITGLDPAGPLYQGVPTDRRLDKTDATFVDVIHTNQKLLGYYGKAGTVDFYPNCGTFQKGCLRVEGGLEGLLNLPTAVVACNHLRAMDYMIESITSDKFVSTSCRGCPGLFGLCVKDLLFQSYTVMGEHAVANPPFDRFYVETNSDSPFAKG